MTSFNDESFVDNQPKSKVLPALESRHEMREVIILRKKVAIPKSSSPESPLNNNDSTSNNKNIAKRSVEITSDQSVTKKKRVVGLVSVNATTQQPQSLAVARRNARERNRVQQVNIGFDTLRQHIPASIAATFTSSEHHSGRGASKKLSKVETLRMAVEYIRSLQQLLSPQDSDDKLYDQQLGSPISFASTSPSPSTISQNPSVNQSYLNENSPAVIDDDIVYDDINSPASSITTNSQYHQQDNNVATNLTTCSDEEVDNRKNFVLKTEINDDTRQLCTSFTTFNYTNSPSRDQQKEERDLFTSIDMQCLPLMFDENLGLYQQNTNRPYGSGHHPTASLSPGVYSEESLSPTEVNDTSRKVMYLPQFSRALRPPLHSVVMESVIQQTYHLMQQMPVKEEVEEENTKLAETGGDVADMMGWWENDQRMRCSSST